MKKTIKIAACPFCGSAGEVNTMGEWSGVGCETFVRPGVMCNGHRHALQYRTPDEAIAAWNHRAAISAAPVSGQGEFGPVAYAIDNLDSSAALVIGRRTSIERFTIPNITSRGNVFYLASDIDSRPRSEDSRAKTVEALAKFVEGHEPTVDGAWVIARNIREQFATTPQKADNE